MDKIDVNKLIDRYLSFDLNLNEMAEVENLINTDPVFREEFIFQTELQEALTETDLINLRENLASIIRNNSSEQNTDASFNLLEENKSKDYSGNSVNTKIFINFYGPLPRIHLLNHNLSLKENVHHLYREHLNDDVSDSERYDTSREENILDFMCEAILEKDIINLRENLKNVASGMPKHHFSLEQIENYISHEMDETELEEFESELKKNRYLKEDVELLSQVNSALQEKEIISLRDKLSAICSTQSSFTQEAEAIEKYVCDELDRDESDNFEDEYIDNPDLRAEVSLYTEVNEAIGETDIIALRDKLSLIRQNLPEKEVKSVVFLPAQKKIRRILTSAAAILLLLLGIGTAIRNLPVQNNQLYSSNYIPYQANLISRSSGLNMELQALQFYENKQYNEALNYFDQIVKHTDKPAIHFYMGSSLQAIGEFKNAITEYKKVISNGNNLFVEIAQWYLSLCYLKIGDIRNARAQLLAINDREGFYSKKAKSILRKMKQ